MSQIGSVGTQMAAGTRKQKRHNVVGILMKLAQTSLSLATSTLTCAMRYGEHDQGGEKTDKPSYLWFYWLELS